MLVEKLIVVCYDRASEFSRLRSSGGVVGAADTDGAVDAVTNDGEVTEPAGDELAITGVPEGVTDDSGPPAGCPRISSEA